jgi:ABC-type transport system substrate-binding protein
VVGWDTRKSISLVLILALLSFALLPAFVRSQPLPAPRLKDGPFVDKIQFKVMPGDDQQVLALLNNDIDLIGDMLDPTFLEELIDTEDIEVASRIQNGYGYLVVNCAKYPFNITAFRRAAAFALDKYAISEDIWNGLAQPQDSIVPVVNPLTIEGQLPYSYYNANIEFGNQLLNEAGFYDVHGDGFREAPDGSSFSVLVESAMSSSVAIEIGEKMAEGLQALHINATSFPTDLYDSLNRLRFHGDYDMVFLGRSFSSFDVDWLAYEFWGEYADVDYQNFANFNNASYDSRRDQLLHATDYFEKLEAALAMQEILVYECPYIICYERHIISAYRTDKFEGFMNDALDGVPAWWTGYKAHLKSASGGPFGGTLRWSTPLDVDSFNHMLWPAWMYHPYLNLLYDSLIRRGPEGNDIDWLAESYLIQTHGDNATVPEDRTRLTFNLLRNVTWTDGSSLTAEDVAFTLNYYRTALGSPLRFGLAEMTSAYAPSEFVFVAEFEGESFSHLHTVGYKPIIPMHVFTEIGPDDWDLWDPNPPAEEMVTSGPFNISACEAGESLEFTFNPNYFFGSNRSAGGESTPTTPTSNGTPFITSFGWPDPFGEMDLVGRVVTTGSLFVIAVVIVLWWKDTRE